MRADFVLRCQNLLSQTTSDMMHFQAGKKNILTNNISYFQKGLYRDVIYLILKLLACQILNIK